MKRYLIRGQNSTYDINRALHEVAEDVTASLGEVSWDDVQGKPANFPPSSHTHSIAQVDGLQNALDSKLGEVTQADIAPLVAGVSPIANPAEATVEDVANAFNALLTALGGGS